MAIGFVDAAKQSHHFSQSQVDGRIVRLIGFFLFTPNGKAQRAGKRGVGFALFAKPTTLLTVRLERFVGHCIPHV